jgi:hypothetical protein
MHSDREQPFAATQQQKPAFRKQGRGNFIKKLNRYRSGCAVELGVIDDAWNRAGMQINDE